MSKAVKAVFFDLDGTLVNTLCSLRTAMNKTMAHFGFDPITEEQTRRYVGCGSRVFVEKSLQATADRLYREAESWEKKDEDRAFELDQQADEVMAELDEAYAYYASIFPENCTYRAEAYPGIPDCLRALRTQGIRIACITNKPLDAARLVLDSAFGESFFDYLSADDGTHPLKPDAGVVRDACVKLQVEPSDCVFVGDTGTDIETARNAGIASIGCVYGFRGRAELERYGATVCVDNAAEILPALRGIVS